MLGLTYQTEENIVYEFQFDRVLDNNTCFVVEVLEILPKHNQGITAKA